MVVIIIMMVVIIISVMSSKLVIVAIWSFIPTIIIINIRAYDGNRWVCWRVEWIQTWQNESTVGHSLPTGCTKDQITQVSGADHNLYKSVKYDSTDILHQQYQKLNSIWSMYSQV